MTSILSISLRLCVSARVKEKEEFCLKGDELPGD
jgi:hypothetical protein